MSDHYTPKIMRHFWSKVDTSGDCWTWQRYRCRKGYGIVRIEGQLQKAHRVAWMMTRGPIPDGMQICHHCDNPPCVRPDHLFLGSQSDNSKDMGSKGRHWLQKQPERSLFVRQPTIKPRGTQNRHAKLTDEQVREIRKVHTEKRVSRRQIARMFNVSETTVRRVVNRELWKHVE